ncbi:MAG: hypothetical protein V7786_07980 [Sulfitobacter litoralis]|jgi:hypothetical protein|uniref:hypothetical protein n=1 Tax=Sulfitobacter litoralis TaxID=335975 RepID=UPI003002E8CE|tara:strand:- start:189 stop:674 length:486 start_codon:yes stop_codon:yes gene_type:complete
MNIAVTRKFSAAEPIDDCYPPIHGFFEEHRDALRNAARLLGGREGVNFVEEIIDALSRDNDLSRRTIRLLYDLEDLLALENVGDPDRAETGYFSAIDILDPVVAEICLLTDGLRAAVAALPEVQRAPSTEAHPGVSAHFSPSRTTLAVPLGSRPDGMGDAK